MRFKCANRISIFLRSRRDCSKLSVPANDRATSRACSWISRGILRDGSFGQLCGLSGQTLQSSLLARYVRERLHPAIGTLSDDVLGRMSGVVAGETVSIETVSSKGNFSPGTGNGESQTILEYHIGSRWVVANVVVKTENNIQRVSGLYFSVNSQPLRDSSFLSTTVVFSVEF
jgi:hypothetical protein